MDSMVDEDWSVGYDVHIGKLNQVRYVSSVNLTDESSSRNRDEESLFTSHVNDSSVNCTRNISLKNHIRDSPSLSQRGNDSSVNQIVADVEEHIAIKNDKQNKKDKNSYGEGAPITNSNESSNCSNGNVISMSKVKNSNSNQGFVSSTYFDESYPYSIVGEPIIVRQGKYPDDWYIKFTGQPDLRLSFRALLPYIRACLMLQICEAGRAHEYVCCRNWMWTEEEQEMMGDEARRILTNQQIWKKQEALGMFNKM